jgi:hypothetical protein
MGDDVVDQMRRRLFLAPRAARRAKAAPLATAGDELVAAAVAAAQSQEAVREDGALQERVELVFDAASHLRMAQSRKRAASGDFPRHRSTYAKGASYRW